MGLIHSFIHSVDRNLSWCSSDCKWNTGLWAYKTPIIKAEALQVLEGHDLMNFLTRRGTKLDLLERFNKTDLTCSLKQLCETLNTRCTFRWKAMSDYHSHCTGNPDSAIWSIEKGTSAGNIFSLPGKNAAVIAQLGEFYSLFCISGYKKHQNRFERTPFIWLHIKQGFTHATPNEHPKLKICQNFKLDAEGEKM